MTYAGVQMFMEKLNQLINCSDNPLFNNPSVVCETPKFQLLYNELGTLIQTLYIDEHQDRYEHQKFNDLKKRFTCLVEEAQYIVDLFLSSVHIRDSGNFPTSEDLKCPLNIDDVMRSFKSFEVELMDDMKLNSSQRREETINPRISAARNSQGSKKLLDEIVIGIDRDVELIRDKLVEDNTKLDVVSIVGMGGIGKTTLATKVFNDSYVKHHFHVRVWVTISQTYDKRDVLIQILASIGVDLDLEKEVKDSKLHEMVHKNLIGKRYLIVIDDIWSIETWDNLKLFFPHDKTRSRILLTSRLNEVAKHANSDGLIHHLGYLNKERSWELLCHKVFHGNEFPKWSIKPGMQIVENCQGLPLAVVAIAGVLAKDAWSEKFWVEIAKGIGSYIVGDMNGCIETLTLSYNHLPLHLRACFLYLGGFPENYNFQVPRLLWLWVAEGFIQQAGNQSLEDIAEGYLMDLIDRNLVTVSERKKSNGRIKACKLHDLFRELCQRIAKEEQFILQTERLMLSSQFSNVITPPYMPCRLFINKGTCDSYFAHPPSQSVRSILWFSVFRFLTDDISKYFHSFLLLRVLDLQHREVFDFPKGMELLVHLRYLAICSPLDYFPSEICNLWNLQTLIYIRSCMGNFTSIILPSNISDLTNLRHLESYLLFWFSKEKRPSSLPFIEEPMNLQTISHVMLGEGINVQRYFPCIRKLTSPIYVNEENDFKSLTYLEKLNITGFCSRMKSTVHHYLKGCANNRITFPTTLKSLTLFECHLPWTDMSILQSLPNLQVLKLKDDAFEGSLWNTDEQEFRQLKFLRLERLNIKMWEAYSRSFPCLKQLQIFDCYHLQEIPLDIGDIPTLELIIINGCRHSVSESVRTIQEEQHDFGNYDLQIDVSNDLDLSLWED
ncbi:putative P-loop containing nucleoside triphosphate hydrolase, leucine-rich repeat domain superfamily [Helianthus annuus]|nr:putative P-loop containing nucleoside triphosphate hydrolase, leucine-rich repeat domain superfamily [Helianthus annuus]